MSVARSLLGRCLASPPAPVRCRQLHSSAARCKRRPRFSSVTARELGLLKPEKREEFRRNVFPDYSKEERAALRAQYTPQQLEAIEAGEKAVDPNHLIFQGRLRDDPHRPIYVEDFTVLNPKYDVKPDVDMTPRDHQWPTQSEWADAYGAKLMQLTESNLQNRASRAMIRALKKVQQTTGHDLLDMTPDELDDLEKDPDALNKCLVQEGADAIEPKADAPASDMLSRAQVNRLDEAINKALGEELKTMHENTSEEDLMPTMLDLVQDGPEGFSRIHSAEAPELGKVPGVAGFYKMANADKDDGKDDEGLYQELKRIMGMSLGEIKSLVCKTLVTRSVHNQTRLGKIRSTSVLAIAGNGNGWLGLGMAKSTEPSTASQTAGILAIRNMKPIRRYENRTIFGNVKGKVSGTVVELFARPPGFGLRCPYRIFEMCRAAGLHDISARIPRSKNPMNSVKATYEALTNQLDPERIAVGRGKKLVDARKVYYGGSVH